MSEVQVVNSVSPGLTRILEEYYLVLGSPSLKECSFKSPTTCPVEVWRSCPIRKAIERHHTDALSELAEGNVKPESVEEQARIRSLVQAKCALERLVGVDLTTGRRFSVLEGVLERARFNFFPNRRISLRPGQL